MKCSCLCRIGWVIIVSAIVSSAGFAQSTSAKEESTGEAASDDAGKRFRQGVQLYKQRDFDGALSEFRAAYQLAPNPRVLYNIGQVCVELQRYAEAVEAFESYLTEVGSAVPPLRRKLVTQELARLSQWVGRIVVDVSEPDADILVDDVVVSRSPNKTGLVVSRGMHRISVSKPGFVGSSTP
jgi:hypothetical protein